MRDSFIDNTDTHKIIWKETRAGDLVMTQNVSAEVMVYKYQLIVIVPDYLVIIKHILDHV